MLRLTIQRFLLEEQYALIKKKINFLINKKIQNGAVAKSYMTNGRPPQGKYLRLSSYIRKPLLILTLQLLHSEFPYI
jgi:hypothetical protein